MSEQLGSPETLGQLETTANPAAPHRLIDVALPLPIEQFFTYAVPDALHDRIALGMRAVVPMNKRVETGYVVGLPETSPLERIRDVLDLPDVEPLIAPDILGLCTWIAEYYCCSLGEALQCAAPPGLNPQTRKRYTLDRARIDKGRYTLRQQEVVALLFKHGTCTHAQIVTEIGNEGLPSALAGLERRGAIVSETVVSHGSVSMRTETWVRIEEDAVPPIEETMALQRRAPKQAAVLLDLLHGEAELPAATLYDRHGANLGILRALEEKGLVTCSEREFYRSPSGMGNGETVFRHALNAQQRLAYNTITRALDEQEFQVFLLKGITGSGKTEVYLQIIERALELGRDAIVLVPEISLTPQTVGRFFARFDRDIAVLHSGLSAGERYDEWRRARRGEVRIVVGARSAIFAPLPNLGIIIVDEEHDTSYKQGETPRYHARDVAIMRAMLRNGVCVLGSATPSVESFHNSERGKSIRIELNQRATNSRLPAVQIVDMREEKKAVGGEVLFSRALESRANECVARGEQVILLLNRRGHSPFVLCPQCGWVANCTDCQVTMTYHERGACLACHYCNAKRAVPPVCDDCHFTPLMYMGAGTQKIEDYLQRSFPDARIGRMDADTTAGKGGHAKILGRFAAQEIDILVGTQMIAKGHDYPGVTLVGVIHADTGLSVPDFRAGEQSFQLLTQVAGRAGRGERPGRVIIQTYRPMHYAIQAAATHDYDAFYRREIEERERLGYPPYRRMLNFAIECEDQAEAERSMARLHRMIGAQREALGFEGLELLGPAPATIRRIKKRYRWNLAALSRSPKRLNALARAIRTTFEAERPKGVQLKIDPDPYGMF